MLIKRTKAPGECPFCGYERGSTHCKHFVSFCVPDNHSFGPDDCTVPDFHGMPVSNRITMTDDGDSAHVESYWMDYETGMEPVKPPLNQVILAILPHERDFIEKVCDAVNVYAHADQQIKDERDWANEPMRNLDGEEK